MSDAGDRLRDLAAHALTEDLAAEVDRLYAMEHAHAVQLLELEDLRRRHHRATVLAGELRDRLARAERRLEDLPLDAIAQARRAAYFLGEGFVRIRHHSRGRYTAEHLPTETVTVRRGD